MDRTPADRPDHPGPRSASTRRRRPTRCAAPDAPDLEAGVAAIRAVVKTLPVRPGVYRMLDARGDVLYVGKARALKNRVNQLHPGRAADRSGCCGWSRRPGRCRSSPPTREAEALLLEAQLIKRYRPPYNVLLRDDKSFPFILLREDHDFPRVQLHRGARRAQGPILRPVRQRRIGPQHAERAAEAVPAEELLRQLLRQPHAALPALPDPPLLGALRRPDRRGRLCRAGRATPRTSSAAARPRSSRSCRQLMAEASEAMDFELAAVYRDRLRALTYVQGSQAIHAERLGDADMFALACKGGTMCIQAFFIRGGQNWGHRSFFPAHTDDVPEDEVLQSFLVQFYEEVPPPRLILTDRDAARGRAARRGLVRAGRAQGRRSRRRSAATRRRMIRQARAQRRGGARPPPRRDLDPGAELCASSPRRSSCPSRRSGSRSTTTATSWAPTRSAR